MKIFCEIYEKNVYSMQKIVIYLFVHVKSMSNYVFLNKLSDKFKILEEKFCEMYAEKWK